MRANANRNGSLLRKGQEKRFAYVECVGGGCLDVFTAKWRRVHALAYVRRIHEKYAIAGSWAQLIAEAASEAMRRYVVLKLQDTIIEKREEETRKVLLGDFALHSFLFPYIMLFDLFCRQPEKYKIVQRTRKRTFG
jgi:hypothetical protein